MKPGGSTRVSVLPFTMHEGMEGPHLFVISMKTNDPATPEKKLSIRANFQHH